MLRFPCVPAGLPIGLSATSASCSRRGGDTQLSLVARRASAQPPLPASFHGTVQLDGADVPGGTTISAWINGQQYAQSDTPGDVGWGTAGDEVSFKVGVQVAIATGIWE